MPDPSQNKWYRRFFGLDPTTDDAETRALTQKAKVATAGVELGGGILLFAGLGYLVDLWLGTEPWGLVTGAMLGMVGGLYLLIKTLTTGQK